MASPPNPLINPFAAFLSPPGTLIGQSPENGLPGLFSGVPVRTAETTPYVGQPSASAGVKRQREAPSVDMSARDIRYVSDDEVSDDEDMPPAKRQQLTDGFTHFLSKVTGYPVNEGMYKAAETATRMLGAFSVLVGEDPAKFKKNALQLLPMLDTVADKMKPLFQSLHLREEELQQIFENHKDRGNTDEANEMAELLRLATVKEEGGEEGNKSAAEKLLKCMGTLRIRDRTFAGELDELCNSLDNTHLWGPIGTEESEPKAMIIPEIHEDTEVD